MHCNNIRPVVFSHVNSLVSGTVMARPGCNKLTYFTVIEHSLQGLVTINLPTKYEVSISARYEDMKRDTECGKWGGLG